MKIRFLIFLTFIVLSFFTSRASLFGKEPNKNRVPFYCDDPKYQFSKITRPMYPSQNSPTVPIAYKFIQGENPSAPTVVYFEGGPGNSSLFRYVNHVNDPELNPISQTLGIDPAFSLLLIDPRGVGCSRKAWEESELPKEEFYQSKQVAQDTVEILKKVGSRNTVYYGFSYGTILATLTATLTKGNPQVTPPQRVILEGTVGRSFHHLEYQWFQGYSDEWSRLLNELPRSIQRDFLNENFPLQLSKQEWANLIWNEIDRPKFRRLMRRLPFLSLDEIDTLKTLSKDSPKKLYYSNQDLQKNASIKDFMRHIFCAELSDLQLYPKVTLQNGKLLPLKAPKNQFNCAHTNRREPYDSSFYSLQGIPIFYLIGKNDLNTPEEHTFYHALNQPQTTRVVLKFEDEGHSPLKRDPCKTDVLKTLMTAPLEELTKDSAHKTLRTALEECHTQAHQLTTYFPTQTSN